MGHSDSPGETPQCPALLYPSEGAPRVAQCTLLGLCSGLATLRRREEMAAASCQPRAVPGHWGPLVVLTSPEASRVEPGVGLDARRPTQHHWAKCTTAWCHLILPATGQAGVSSSFPRRGLGGPEGRGGLPSHPPSNWPTGAGTQCRPAPSRPSHAQLTEFRSRRGYT